MTPKRKRITLNPRILRGKPILRGTRIPIYLIMGLLASGMTEDEILGEYPQLSHDDIQAVLEYASRILREEQVIPLAA